MWKSELKKHLGNQIATEKLFELTLTSECAGSETDV